jgi:hypothetical protein
MTGSRRRAIHWQDQGNEANRESATMCLAVACRASMSGKLACERKERHL